MMKKCNTPAVSPLNAAVELTEDTKGCFKPGLGAFKGNERDKIVVPDSRKITGSVDIDSATREKYPEENRWDYALEYDNEVFFIEIHPGSTSEVATILAKLDWLKKWLKTKAPQIEALKATSKPAFHWVYTNKYAILPGSKYAKILSQKKLVPVKQWNYSQL